VSTSLLPNLRSQFLDGTGKFEFMILDSRFGTEQFIDFMERLIRYKRRKVFLIVDGHPVHKSKSARTWVENNKDRIALFFLPSYSPQLNPTELA
jgi:transposase